MTQQNQNPQKTSQSKEILDSCLTAASGLNIKWTDDRHDNPYGWLVLEHPSQLSAVAEALAQNKARLCTVTAYDINPKEHTQQNQAIAYHFALNDTVITITVPLYDHENQKPLPVPSITPWFRNADWNEREFSEMFKITIEGHPNPKRLFLDERLDAGIMSSLIPFSAMVHGAAGKTLWEQVMSAKGVKMSDKHKHEPHLTPGAEHTQALEEPKFTPVSETAEKTE